MYSLKNSYVRQKGKIFPWGAVRILDNSVPESNDAYAGLWIYSEKLAPFRKGKHFAKIEDGQLMVYSKKNSRKSVTISSKEVHSASDVDVELVDLYGYLNNCGSIGMRFKKPLLDKFTIKLLRNAEAGERPTSFDDSSYVRVSTKYLGQKLVTIDISKSMEPQKGKFMIYTFDGKLIPEFTVVHPLSFKKWGEPRPDLRMSAEENQLLG
ncbi:MAG: hypothetical protein KBB54_01280 [Candidatus Pacebacteria bacterium]|nr:hypothetical protein [Candidatus Paceibacterota bacterium]